MSEALQFEHERTFFMQSAVTQCNDYYDDGVANCVAPQINLCAATLSFIQIKIECRVRATGSEGPSHLFYMNLHVLITANLDCQESDDDALMFLTQVIFFQRLHVRRWTSPDSAKGSGVWTT